MDLRTPDTYWVLKNGFENSYPVCDKDIKADVAVIGAGITGALTAYALVKAGLDVAVLEKRHLAMGSTAASTALLQYEIDEPLHSLIEKCGPKRAEAAYEACYQAIDTLAEIICNEGIEADFRYVPSLQYASYKKDVPDLKKEYAARKKLGFAVQLLEPEDINLDYGIIAPGALYSSKAAQVDPYRLARGLLRLPMPNLRVFDCSEVVSAEEHRRDVTLLLKNGGKVTARKAVIACGYESLKYVPFSVADIGTTYALITKPLTAPLPWKEQTLLWETKEPYLYLRTTADNRLLFGGRDDERYNPAKLDGAMARKVKGLLDDVAGLWPDIDLFPDFTWAGAFANTKDTLGYAGTLPSRPNVYFNMGFGGNGILYSQIGAEVICSGIVGKKHPYSRVFEFER